MAVLMGRFLAFSMIGAGLLLLAAAGAYYGYAYVARLGLDELTVVMERPSRPVSGTSVTSDPEPAALVRIAPAAPSKSAGTVGVSPAVEPVTEEPPSVAPTVAKQAPVRNGSSEGATRSMPPRPTAPSAALSPQQQSELLDADAITAPAPVPEQGTAETPTQAPEQGAAETPTQAPEQGAAETPAQAPQLAAVDVATSRRAEANGSDTQVAGEAEVVALFRRVSEIPETERYTFLDPSPNLLPNEPARATRIYIPALDLESDIQELGLLTKGDRLEWETPKWVVGHVPVTGQPGVAREGWYFGHLQSPLRREGNVFRRLPEIPPKLKQGQTVQIVLETADRKFLYQVYKTEVVYQNDLAITNSGEQDITLVTCYPTLVYDHRLLVTATLVGVTES